LIAQLLHELRGPLAPIVGALELLRAPERAAQERAQAILERQIKHLMRLIDDMVELTRGTRSGLTLNLERVTLAGVVEQAIELAAPLLAARNHDLRVDVSSELCVHGDPGRLVQVIANLVTNSAKYTDDGGAIRLRAERVDDHVVMSIRDNGIGIGADVLPHVFDMFVRAPRARRGPYDGLGLGLYIVRALVRQHGGTVEARSDGTGCGSEFVVKLPCAPEAAALLPSAGA
jgi:signal transduction histidine kinase